MPGLGSHTERVPFSLDRISHSTRVCSMARNLWRARWCSNPKVVSDRNTKTLAPVDVLSLVKAFLHLPFTAQLKIDFQPRTLLGGRNGPDAAGRSGRRGDRRPAACGATRPKRAGALGFYTDRSSYSASSMLTTCTRRFSSANGLPEFLRCSLPKPTGMRFAAGTPKLSTRKALIASARRRDKSRL